MADLVFQDMYSEEIAGHCEWDGRRSLHRAFASQSTSVMGYVRERRLERARSELMTTSLTIHEIAARWHFSDDSHFIKAYKKKFGELPGNRRGIR